MIRMLYRARPMGGHRHVRRGGVDARRFQRRGRGAMKREREPRWLLLLHQIPRTPGYLRVKIWRRLQRLGAVAIKNGAYALPRSEEHNEDLRWVMNEIVAGGGEATLIEAGFIHGMTDGELEALFNQARDGEYAELNERIRAAARRLPKRGK